MIPPTTDFSLYFVTDTALCGGVERVPHVVYEAVMGGVGVVQEEEPGPVGAAASGGLDADRQVGHGRLGHAFVVRVHADRGPEIVVPERERVHGFELLERGADAQRTPNAGGRHRGADFGQSP